jgi:hypothetical protein
MQRHHHHILGNNLLSNAVCDAGLLTALEHLRDIRPPTRIEVDSVIPQCVILYHTTENTNCR